MPKQTIRCTRCGGWCYYEDPYSDKSDIWCIMCGEWQLPPNFKPLPIMSKNEEPSFKDTEWYIDEHGDIIDIIDKRIEKYIADKDTFTVSAIAKKINCAISEVRMTLERLMRHGQVESYRYGPPEASTGQPRWTGYRKTFRKAF